MARKAVSAEQPAFAVVTLGCRVNQYECRAVADALRRQGWREVDVAQAAHVVVNACAVTGKASRKTRRMVYHLCRVRKDRRVYVMGCVTVQDRAAMLALPQVRAFVPPEKREEIVEILTGSRGPKPALWLDSFGRRSRAYVKVQDGCDRFCTYCIVPHLRGRSRSRPAEEVEREMDGLLAGGINELWLVGTDLPSWGNGRLPDLLDRVAGTVARRGARLRLGTVSGEAITEELVAVFRRHRAICRHVHLSLQSGSTFIRQRMGRRTLPEEILRRTRLFAATFPGMAFSADVMVGFPGESETDFAATYGLCRRIGFLRLHIFPFSPRPGTRAADLPDRLEAGEIAWRIERLGELARSLRRAYGQRLIGQTVEVIVEKTGREFAEGVAEQYVKVRFSAAGCRRGDMVRVRITAVEDEVLRGKRDVCSTTPASTLG